MAALRDLRVTILRSSILRPPENVERRLIFLSNIDQQLDFNRLESAMEELLVSSYDFLAGRLSWDESEARWELDCNGAGVGFVEAASELTLPELGDLELPNPVLSQLVAGKADAMDIEDRPLFVIRLTAFKCGAFAMGISNSHATFDGVGFRTFMENLAALAAAKPWRFRHSKTAACYRYQLSRVGPERTALPLRRHRLQRRRRPSLALQGAGRWRRGSGQDVDGALRGGHPERLRPPLPRSFTGNAVLSAYSGMTHRELREEPFGRVVEVVREGSARMDEDYVRSAIDWGQLYKGFPRGDVLISSWWRLGLDEVEFRGGRPCVARSRPGGARLGTTPPGAIPRFERFFYDFL
ncbi:unnamed protein product [Spirodela intermedia]|uniref:Uncharacterized protein n=1 Tax=Spirodela intermedia TaxID=51605 RepID=A0A7I8IRF2_SPIIN|nr:unnamed protein product [Spirodela intermedia]CAA6660127.1 unnamed protein product [Spirodela intermedia]